MTTLTWLHDGDRRLLVRVDTPDDGSAVGAVVFVPSLAREALASNRTQKVFAIEAARAGYVCLSFTFTGDGDSESVPDGQDLVQTWIGDVQAVRRLARRIVGDMPVHTVALRLGAAVAAEVDHRIDEAQVFWEPTGGRAFLMHHRTIRRVSVRIAPLEGCVELTGFTLSPEQAKSLTALKAPRLDPVNHPKRILRVEEDRERAKLIALASPHHVVVPFESIRRILDGLPRHTPTPLPPWEPVTEVELAPRDGRRVRERVCEVGPDHLPGVLTWSDDVPVRRALAFTAMGAEVRTGPADLWARAARDLAAHGVMSLRADRRLLGDALDPSAPGEARPYTDHSVEDVAHAARHLQQLSGLPVSAVGVCSGGWVWIRAAAQAPIDRILAVNGVHWNPDPGAYDEAFYQNAFSTTTDLSNWDEGAESDDEGHQDRRTRALALLKEARHRVAIRYPRLRAFVRSEKLSAGVGALFDQCPPGLRVELVFGRWEYSRFRAQHGPEDIVTLGRRGIEVTAEQSDLLDHSVLSATALAELRRRLFVFAGVDDPGLPPALPAPARRPVRPRRRQGSRATAAAQG